jgi:hypothetical protein
MWWTGALKKTAIADEKAYPTMVRIATMKGWTIDCKTSVFIECIIE